MTISGLGTSTYAALAVMPGLALAAGHYVVADSTPAPVIGGLFGALAIFGGYLLRELNRASGGAWRVVKEKNATLHRQAWEIAFWQHQADPGRYADPGFYKPPTDQELKSW